MCTFYISVCGLPQILVGPGSAPEKVRLMAKATTRRIKVMAIKSPKMKILDLVRVLESKRIVEDIGNG